jgi:hypothetical protein
VRSKDRWMQLSSGEVWDEEVARNVLATNDYDADVVT